MTPQPQQFDPEAFAAILASKCRPGVLESLSQKPFFLPADVAPDCFSGLFQSFRYKIYYGGRGGSKCLKTGTKIIMADASLRKIEEIQKEDKVMGPDGLPRLVLSTTKGVSELYKIKQSPAIDYIVNSEHILSLKKSNNSKKPYDLLPSGKYRHPNGRYPSWPDITNIKVTEALKQSKRWGEHFRGYKCECLPFPQQKIDIDPYFLGVWLGDGTGRELRITTADKEIVDSCKRYAKSFGGNISINGKSDNKAKDIGFLIKKGRINPLWQRFKKYNLPDNKHIPSCYIYNSEQSRLALLAGFIDTDGSLKHNCYNIIQKSESLIKGICLIANTLGFKTNLRKRRCTCGNNGKVGDYWALTISGDAWRIPVKIDRKKIDKKDCTPNKDFLVSKIKVEPQGIGEYAGIGIDGDHLFLLEDGTVTHNSWSIARALVNAAYEKPLRILCTREFQSSIADSVHRLISDQISDMGLSDYFDITKTAITSTAGSQFIFKGLRHSIQEIKSTEGVDIVWVEEAQVISERSWEVLIPTIRKENSEIWMSFNPNEETDPTYQRFINNTPPDSICVKVGWEDNPFFPETLNAERKYMLRIDPEAYDHVWGGDCRKIGEAVIFKNRIEVATFNEPPEGTQFYYGADWGFSQDPTVLTRSWVADKCLYVDYEAYGVGVEIDDLPELFDQVPRSRDWNIKADNSRPETISHMKRRGFKVESAPKWPGCVEDGIVVMKGFEKIIVHERCKHTAKEFRLYSYKTDRLTEEILPIIIDKHNHCIDSIRYGIGSLIRVGFFSGSDMT